MYDTSLIFRIKDTLPLTNHKILELFFKSWVDEACHNNVKYEISRDINGEWEPGNHIFNETFRVTFKHRGDAVALKLKGIPQSFQNYIEFVN
jgi:hypothetical protein